MGGRGYPPEFRRRELDLVDDRGLEPGPTSAEKTELADITRRIAGLETGLAIARRAVDELAADWRRRLARMQELLDCR